MVIKFQTSDKTNGNKGSCSALANYLEKEDLEREKNAFDKGELPMPRTGFFSSEKDGLMKVDVIDSNKNGLGKQDSKFYAVTISPSKQEQKHILKSITEKEVGSIQDLTAKELKAYENKLKDYSRKLMNEYATHFNRTGLKRGNQLLYFGKVEHCRAFKGTDKEVKNGIAKSGHKKPGLQTHIHLIVSRKDKEMKFKLSPLANEKGKGNNSKLNGKNVKRGFDRNLFNIKGEKLFDENYNYKRQLSEKVEYRIEASKNEIQKSKIELTQDKREKAMLQQKMIERYNSRNRYQENDKQLSQELDKEKQKQTSKGIGL